MLGVHRVRWRVRFVLFVRSAWRGLGVFSCASAADVLCPQRGGLVPPRRRFCASTTEVLCLHRGGVVPPPRRSCASTAEVLCLHNGGLVPPPRSLTAAASLQRCYAAATGCSNAPVLSAIKGLLGPAALVLQSVHQSPLAARSHAAVTAGVSQSSYQSRDYWSLQPLCCSRLLQHLCSVVMLQPLAAVMPQSRHQSRGYWGLQSLCRSLCTTAHWQHARMLQSLQECPSPVTNQGTIGACSPCVAA